MSRAWIPGPPHRNGTLAPPTKWFPARRGMNLFSAIRPHDSANRRKALALATVYRDQVYWDTISGGFNRQLAWSRSGQIPTRMITCGLSLRWLKHTGHLHAQRRFWQIRWLKPPPSVFQIRVSHLDFIQGFRSGPHTRVNRGNLDQGKKPGSLPISIRYQYGIITDEIRIDSVLIPY